MRGLEPKHYLLLSGFLGALAIQIGGLQHGWHDAASPGFVAGLLLQISTMLGALYAGAPGATGQMTDRRHEDTGKIADPSRLSDSTKLPVLPWIIAASLLAGGATLLATIPGCVTLPPTITTQAGAKAYTADQWVDRLREFSNVVKADTGTQPGNISPADAFAIIEWVSGDAHAPNGPTVGILQAIESAGTGGTAWMAAKLAWEGRIKGIVQSYPNLRMYADVIDELLKVVVTARVVHPAEVY